MLFVKSWIVAVLLSVASLSITSAPASAQSANNLSGVWQGVYWGGGQQPTDFQATLSDEVGPAFTGSTVEANAFGDQSSPFLLATLAGRAQQNGNVSFTKTYDGTAGVSHSVTYSGQVLSNGRRIVGTWAVEGLSGQFELAR